MESKHPTTGYWEAQGFKRGQAEAHVPGLVPLQDDAEIRQVFYEESKNVPTEWVEAYGRGYLAGRSLSVVI